MSAKLSYQRHTSAAVPFAGSFSWRRGLCPQLLGTLSAACAAADGWRNRDDTLGDFGWLEEEGRACVLLDQQGDLGKLELHVQPGCRGQGWGDWLLREGIAELERRGAGCVDVWAYGDRDQTVSWLERFGFETKRLLFSLQRPAIACPAQEWPPEWRVRAWQPGDEAAWHSLHSRLQADPRLAWSLDRLGAQLQDDGTPPGEFWLLLEGDELQGYAWLKRTRELFMFALAPECRGRGMGRRLLRHALSRCSAEVLAYCDEARQAALGLLRSEGFQEMGRDRCLRLSL